MRPGRAAEGDAGPGSGVGAAGARALCAGEAVPLSSLTGEGVEALRQALLDAEHTVGQRSARGGFRLAVDRAFAVAGAGVVVTGTALAGQVSAGDTLLLGKAGKPVRVRGLHAQNQAALVAQAGQRVALNLHAERLALEQIHRGDWLVPDWLHAPCMRVDIDLTLLPSETRTFEHFSAVHVHLGTQDVTARVALLEGRNCRQANGCSPSCCSTHLCRRCMAIGWCSGISAPNVPWAVGVCSTPLPRVGSGEVKCACGSCRL